MSYQLWLVEWGVAHVIVGVIGDRERAKERASKWLGGNPDVYTVTPLTEPGDRIHLDITIQV